MCNWDDQSCLHKVSSILFKPKTSLFCRCLLLESSEDMLYDPTVIEFGLEKDDFSPFFEVAIFLSFSLSFWAIKVGFSSPKHASYTAVLNNNSLKWDKGSRSRTRSFSHFSVNYYGLSVYLIWFDILLQKCFRILSLQYTCIYLVHSTVFWNMLIRMRLFVRCPTRCKRDSYRKNNFSARFTIFSTLIF